MLRRTLLYLSSQPRIFRLVRTSRFARRAAARFVAGETLDEAVTAVRALNQRGISATVDMLGESVTSADMAGNTAAAYERILERIATEGLDANVSVKLTALGMDIGETLCRDNISRVVARAAALGNFVRLDMESSAYTQRTLDLFEQVLWPAYPGSVGIVLQSYLTRTEGDVARAIALRCRVRLCKGAYREPPEVAFQRKADVDANYARCAHRLLEAGTNPGIATHDERLINDVVAFARAQALTPDRFEFQMLYGVRRDLQEQLVRDGWRMRVYVPFGTHWYPYLMRRLAERPANLAFIVGNVLRERRRIRRKA